MTKEEQMKAIFPWFAAMQARIVDGVEKGRVGWRTANQRYITVLLLEEVAKLIDIPTTANAADVANLAFMLTEAKEK